MIISFFYQGIRRASIVKGALGEFVVVLTHLVD